MNRFLIFVSVFFCWSFSDLRAQRWSMTVTTGLNLYKGDLSDWKLFPSLNQLKDISSATKFNVRYQRTQAFAYRAQISIGKISGDGSNNPGPNFNFNNSSFTSPLVEMSGLVDYNFLDYQSDRKIKNWSPYLFGGISYLFANPKGGTFQGLPFFTLAIPYGVGVKYQLTPRLGLQIEFGTSKSFTDMLDNSTSDGLNRSHFTTQQTDQVLQTSISVTYSFKSVFCPRE